MSYAVTMISEMTTMRKAGIGLVAFLLVVGLGYGFWPTATPVTVARADRDSMRVVIEEEGQTRLRDRYVLEVPATGYLRRIEVSVGDSVTDGDELARLTTRPEPILDAGTYEMTAALADRGDASLERRRAERKRASAEYRYRKKELARVRALREAGEASEERFDRVQFQYRQAKARLEAARRAIEQARAERRAARSYLSRSSNATDSLAVRASVTAPVNGRVLRVHRKDAGVVKTGTPLVTIGDPDSLEVIADVLSSEAVRISSGVPVRLVRWGGGQAARGTVRVVSPEGRTDVSALGVEQQRVRVITDLTGPPSVRRRLGAGYRVVARFVVWQGRDVLQVPQSSLFRHEGGWAVFTVRNGEARLQPVQVGHRSGLMAEIRSGLKAGTRVVTHPGNQLSDGTEVEVRR